MAAIPAQSELRTWAAVIEDALAQHGTRLARLCPTTGPPSPIGCIAQVAARGLISLSESHIFEQLGNMSIDISSVKLR
jgi:hypothetical protein